MGSNSIKITSFIVVLLLLCVEVITRLSNIYQTILPLRSLRHSSRLHPRVLNSCVTRCDVGESNLLGPTRRCPAQRTRADRAW
jgi:hypothetical protein